jgi:Domain of unknown function (DUF397)
MAHDLPRAQWRKSSYSGDEGGNCVEVASNRSGVVAVRDSKNPTGPALTFPPGTWSAFVSALKTGALDV